MENEKGLKALLILTAIALLGVSMWVVYLINPMPEGPSQVKVERNVMVRDVIKSKDINPPLHGPEGGKKELAVSDDVVARQVIADHIDDFLPKSYKGFGGKSRTEYINVIAETLVSSTKSTEEAFWLCGMMQSESSFRLIARPGRSTNSSARGFLQVITRYHGDVLNPAGISKKDLETDIEKSVLGGVLVFHKYRYPKRGGERTLRDATRRYRSLSASEAEQTAYFNAARSVFQKLMKDFKEVRKQK